MRVWCRGEPSEQCDEFTECALGVDWLAEQELLEGEAVERREDEPGEVGVGGYADGTQRVGGGVDVCVVDRLGGGGDVGVAAGFERQFELERFNLGVVGDAFGKVASEILEASRRWFQRRPFDRFVPVLRPRARIDARVQSPTGLYVLTRFDDVNLLIRSPHTSALHDGLGRGKSLSLIGVVAQSIGFLGPVFSAAFLLPSVAGLGFSGKGAGVASPIAMIIAALGIGGVAFLAQIVEVDVPSLGTTRRSPERLRRTLAALGRNVGQPIKLTQVAADIGGESGARPAVETVTAYLDTLERLKLTENSPSWRPHMRSRTQLREAPVRYFIDPSLGTAALGVGSKELLADLKATGFHFEALAVRDLRIYAQPLGGTISTWRETHGRREVDAIVETSTGWAAFEVKLTGDQAVIDAAANGLVDFASEIDHARHGAPSALVVITATGGGGRRPDGVHVVPITALGP